MSDLPVSPPSGTEIVRSMFLQVVSEHAWPRTETLAGPAPTRRAFATNKACPSNPQLYQRNSGLENSLGTDWYHGPATSNPCATRISVGPSIPRDRFPASFS